MSVLDYLVALALILLICGLAGALGVVLADWRRYSKWFRSHLRWQRVTSAWGRWAR